MLIEQFTNTLRKVEKEENNVFMKQSGNIVVKADQMISFLSDVLNEIKVEVLKKDFNTEQEEIYFFKEVKPQILGKILFYRNLIDIEILCPKINLKQQVKYYKTQISSISENFSDEFYRYILLGRKDKDEFFFLRKNINHNEFRTIHKDFFLN